MERRQVGLEGFAHIFLRGSSYDCNATVSTLMENE